MKYVVKFSARRRLKAAALARLKCMTTVGLQSPVNPCPEVFVARKMRVHTDAKLE
jgi:hypothetical protein